MVGKLLLSRAPRIVDGVGVLEVSGKDSGARQNERRGLCRFVRVGRYVLGSKPPEEQTKSFKRIFQSHWISTCSHNSTCHQVRSSRPSAGRFLALSLDDLTLWHAEHAEMRSNKKTVLL